MWLIFLCETVHNLDAAALRRPKVSFSLGIS